jgi:hypothetical protein
MTPEDEAFFDSFVARARWKFARTMAKTPHSYTMLDWEPYEPDWIRFVRIVHENSTHAEKFYRRTFYYFVRDEWKYWLMDKDPANVVLVNRAEKTRTYGKQED